MSKDREIGQLSQRNDHELRCQIEWTVEDIFSFSEEDEPYRSPPFCILDSRWHLLICPNGLTCGNAPGWISLYLRKEDDQAPPESADFSLGVRRADGAVEKRTGNLRFVFEKYTVGYGRSRFLERLELAQRRSELAPSDALTVTCSVSVDNNSVANKMRDTLSSNFADLFASKRGCDVTLRVQNQEFPVHKCILAARSTVFDAMLEADMKEKQTGVVDIQDCDPGAFKDFLKYIYSGKYETNSKKVFELYRIADKYCVDELKSACVLDMASELSVENVCETAILGDKFCEEELKQKTQVFFNGNFGKITSTASWGSLLETNRHLADEMLQKYSTC